MGVPVNNPASNRDNCPKISSACVIWQGPNIPCINLCSGDTIDEVVFKLATYLCELSQNIFDIENINFECLLDPVGSIAPTNLEQLIQSIINYLCNGSPTPFASPSLLNAQRIVGVSAEGEPILELPLELCYYNEEGDYVSSLVQTEYNVYVATKLAEVIVDITNYQQELNYLSQQVRSLQTDFENIVNSTNDIYIVSQCASSGTPGQQVLIQDAFTTFERNYCNLTSTIGTTTSLFNGINTQISNLSNLPQLMNDRLQMRNLPRWVQNTNNIGESLTNLWLTIGDMRSKIIEVANNTYSVPCILLSPENMTIGTIGTLSTEVYWEKPSVEDVQQPTSYSIQVFALSDTQFTNPLFSQTKSETGAPNVINIASPNIQIDVEYVIQISSIYQCGMSRPSSLISKLRVADVLFQVIADFKVNDRSANCIDRQGVTTGYIERSTEAYFDLKLKTSGLIIPNNGITPITIIARFQIDSCEYTEPVYDNVTFTIDVGESRSNIVTYISNKLTNCTDGTCGSYEKYLLCGVFVSEPSAEFDPEYGSCN